ncbi:hypothetical protein DX980_05075 [Burkholderia gladioli]|nr:hypothetical protein C3Y08_00575 [Burkholderia gladioli]WAG18680.1 hypothetical protein DX980_05075 [Burkholderia gladioli]
MATAATVAATPRAARVAARQPEPGRFARPRQDRTGASAPVFFSPAVDISRCGKFFCLVKNHAAWHKPGDCEMEKDVSHRETTHSSH